MFPLWWGLPVLALWYPMIRYKHYINPKVPQKWRRIILRIFTHLFRPGVPAYSLNWPGLTLLPGCIDALVCTCTATVTVFQSGRGGCPRLESFHYEHSSICLNPLSTDWKFTHHMFISWCGSYLLPGDHTDHMHHSDPPGLLRWPDPAHGNSVRSHSWPDCGMSGILQSMEWSQPCLVDTSCAQALTPTLHIDSTQYGNAAQ